MPRKALACLMTFCILTALAPAASAKTKAEKDAVFAERVRVGIAKLGAGEDARVEVRLRDRSKLAGYIQSSDADGFVIRDFAAGNATIVAYANVAKVKGHNLSTGAKIAIGIGVTVGIIILIWTIIWFAAID